MNSVLISLVLVGYVTAAKLDHLQYLPPHSRPTSTNGNQDAGLEAPGPSSNIKSSSAAPSSGQNGPINAYGHPNSQSAHQHPQFPGVNPQQQLPQQPQQPSKPYSSFTQQPAQGFNQQQPFGQQVSAFPAPASQKFTQPQPSNGFNQKSAFGVNSNDDSIEIDAPVVGNGQNSFGLPNPSRQYLSPFGNQPSNQPTHFNGPAKLQSIFGNQKSQQQSQASPFGSSSSPQSSPTQQHQLNTYQAPSSQYSHSAPQQSGPSYSAPSQPIQPSHSGPKYTAPQQSAPQNNNFNKYQSTVPQNQFSNEAPKSFGTLQPQQIKQKSQQNQNSAAPYQYNKPSPSFPAPSFGGNNSPQAPGFPQNNYNAPSAAQPTQGFASSSEHQVPQGSVSVSQSNGGPQNLNQGPVPHGGSQYPEQAQDENGGYLY